MCDACRTSARSEEVRRQLYCVFRINEILTTVKQYFEGLGAIVNETNNNYQELNPLQYGGGGIMPPLPIGFSYAASKRFAVGRSNFRTFNIYVLGS